MNWRVPPIWEGGDVWILGGGPSMTEQFGIPQEVVQQVVAGTLPPSAYSPYMSVLHDKHVIGVNVAYLIGDWIDMMLLGDVKFFLAHSRRLAQWPGIRISCHKSAIKVSWMKYLARDMKHPLGISFHPDMVSWNGNSGAAAISVAANAGAKRILLLGFDMGRNGEGRQHWHTLYKDMKVPVPAGRIAVQRKRVQKGVPPTYPPGPFVKHLKGFPQIARDAKERGIEIINLSPNSAIKEFPKMTLEEWLQRENTGRK